MKFLIFSILVLNICLAADKENKTISLFGSNPIQLNLGKDGVSVQKTPGFTCELDASLGGGHYSEWGQTEDDARELVDKKCSKNSGAFLCKKSKAICKQDL